MAQSGIPAVFMRGGTSKGLFFHERDLPSSQAARAKVFLASLGSPDPYERQLDGMGGGISSLSKVMIVAPSARDDADVDYLFGQVAVNTPDVDFTSNCGNLTSAIGPFAVEEGLVPASGDEARLRLFNVNTRKLIESRFPLAGDNRPATAGDYRLPGVSGTGARISLDFLDPGGAVSGSLLPTGKTRDRLEGSDFGTVEASIVDATNPVCFVPAEALNLQGIESPARLRADGALLEKLEAIRLAAAVTMGLAPTLDEAASRWKSSPKIAVVAPPRDSTLLDGSTLSARSANVMVRMISMGVPHAAVPLTGGMCAAVAARIEGTVVHDCLRGAGAGPINIAHPSGVLDVDAAVRWRDGWVAERATVFRTCRRLMAGQVYVPADVLELSNH